MNKTIVFISDFYTDEVPLGGAELVNENLINLLKDKGYRVKKEKSTTITVNILRKNKHLPIIVGNFYFLPEKIKQELANESYNYIIYEHDHKYAPDRNPGKYKDFLVPEDAIINKFFYEKSSKVICQCSHHQQIVQKNLKIDNIINLGYSLWDQEFLDNISKIDTTNKKGIAIVKSDNPIKNQKGAEVFCKKNNLAYTLISSESPFGLVEEMAKYEKIVYLPKVPESFSRIAVEAKMVGCKLITNKLLGCSYEKWFSDTSSDIIREMNNSRKEVVSVFEDLFEFGEEPSPRKTKKDLVSIVVPTYNDAEYLRESLDDIVNQTYDKIEVILVNDGSTDNTEQILKEYCNKYNNFSYFNKENGGTGDALNYGFEKITGEFSTWFSSDDRKDPDMIEKMVTFLKDNRHVEYAFSAYKSEFFNRIIRAYVPDGEFGFKHINLQSPHDNNPSGQSYVVNDWLRINREQCYQGVNFMFTTRLKDECGEFLTIPGEDYYMSVLMGLHSRVGYLDDCLGTHRSPPDSMSIENRNCVTEANQRTWNLIDINYNQYRLQ